MRQKLTKAVSNVLGSINSQLLDEHAEELVAKSQSNLELLLITPKAALLIQHLRQYEVVPCYCSLSVSAMSK